MLLQTVKPDAKENLLGYIMRVVDKNRYQTPMWLCRRLGIRNPIHTLSYLDRNIEDRSKLVDFMGISTDEISNLCYPSVKNDRQIRYRIFNQEIPKTFLRPENHQICPKCLSENPVYDKLWDIYIIDSCPFHRCKLIDTCPKCKRAIRWDRSSLVMCNCGYDFRTANIQYVKMGDMVLSSLIYNKCNRMKALPDDIVEILGASPWGNLDLSSILILVVTLSGAYNGHNWSGLRNRSNNQIGMLLNNALPILLNWPCNYFHFLSEVLKNNTNKITKGVHAQFGRYYQAIYQELLNTEFNFLREAFEDYIASNWRKFQVVKRSLVHNANYKQISEYISMSEAERILDVSRTSLDRLIRNKSIKTYTLKDTKMKVILIEKESLYLYKNTINEAVSKKDAAKILGINVKKIISLQQKGFIKAINGSYNEYMYSKLELSNFINKLNSKCQREYQKSKKSMLDFKQTGLYLKRDNINQIDIIEMILKGNIIPIKFVGLAKINELYFYQNDIDQIIFPDLITAKQAGSLFKCDPRRISDTWIRMGLLTSVKDKRLLFERKHVEIALEQRKNLVTLSEATKMLKCSATYLTVKINKGSLLPIAGPRLGNAAQNVFRKEDILKLKSDKK